MSKKLIRVFHVEYNDCWANKAVKFENWDPGFAWAVVTRAKARGPIIFQRLFDMQGTFTSWGSMGVEILSEIISVK